MENTKHDLSLNLAQLDFEALFKTAEIAFSKTREELDIYKHKLYNCELNEEKTGYKYDTSFWMNGNRIKVLGNQLAIVCETLHTLYEARKRKKIEIINRKEFL